MAIHSSALTGLMVLIAATAGPVHAQQVTITIEEINTVVFPADGDVAAQDICGGLASGALTRDQVGSTLVRLQRALSEVNKPESAISYVKAFNRTAADIKDCNVQVTGPDENNLWNY